jgi:uncharacterized protein (DUF362 family)/Pyruvate/2-oxoacid:ferredoxin oxidoreductase delta subunit
MDKVAVVKTSNYDTAEVERGIRTAIDLAGGMATFVKQGQKVLIKPNMLESGHRDFLVTTHPEVVRAVIRLVKEAGGIPWVGDSPAFESTQKVAEKTGIAAVCREEGASLVSFDETCHVSYAAGKMAQGFSLAKACVDADVIISVAKMKTHSLTGITGAVKNLFGTIVGAEKAQYHLRMQKHADFATWLVDLAVYLQPALSIIDGVRAMEGQGPRNGGVYEAGLVLAGANPFAVDAAMRRVMGFEGNGLPVETEAAKRGLLRLEDLELWGDGRELVLRFAPPHTYENLEDVVPPWLVAAARRELTAWPMVDDAKCIRCGRCVAHCPPQAMVLRGKVIIDRAKCIRCYCCQELCPADAVQLKKGRLLRWWLRWKRWRSR